jgi:hypothetical protein
VEKDLKFISGIFFDNEISKDKCYLLKYFKTPLQIAFLRYHIVFDGDVHSFPQHTGYHCSRRLCVRMKMWYRELEEAHAKAKTDFSEEGMKLLWQIESGKYSVKWVDSRQR